MAEKGDSKGKRILTAGGVLLILLCLVLGVLFWQKIKEQEEEGEKPDNVKLTLVYAYQNAQWNQGIQTIAEAFQKKYENIEIDVQVQYENKVYEDVLSKLQARGQMGDIIQMKTPIRYAREGLLAPIEERIGEELEDVCVYDGSIYGAGAVGSTNGIIYNRDIFETYQLEEPKTYGEFLNLCKKLKQHGITPIGIAGGDLWHMEFWVNHFFRTDIIYQNKEWLQERREGAVSWQDEEALQMLTHLQQLFTSGYVNQDWAVKEDGNLAYGMSQGEVAMMYTGSWTARELQKQNPKINLGWFYVPDEDGAVIVSQNKDVYWSLTKKCGEEEQKYQAALSFLEFFYDSEIYITLCDDIYGFPVTLEKKENSKEGIQGEIQEKFSKEQLPVSEYIGNETTPQGFEKSLLYGVQDLAAGKTDIAGTAQKLDELWDYYQKQEE